MTTETTRRATNHKLCGCRVSCAGDQEHEPRITYCPTHAAAPEMANALRAMLQAADELMTEYVSKKRAANWGVINDAMVAAGTLLRRIEGE